jgi:hypothetical protein
MATKRKTAQDYKKELADIKLQKKALEARIVVRAKELCKQCPDIWVTYASANGIPTSSFINMKNLHVNTALSLINIIEKELADKHPHKQTEMF